jgi:ubiquitin-protein ligase
MYNNFPQFVPLVTESTIGFRGALRGSRSGRIYTVTIQAPIHSYPAEEPVIYITPRPENHHWLSNGQLCADRHQRWQPGKDTFATCVLVAIKYIDRFDSRR